MGVSEFAIGLVIEAGGDKSDEVGEQSVVFDVEGIDGETGFEGREGG